MSYVSHVSSHRESEKASQRIRSGESDNGTRTSRVIANIYANPSCRIFIFDESIFVVDKAILRIERT